jgi:glycosyltransferase involved in cell wall biosynthesis
MRVLAITKIFPNSLEPLSSPFNRQQFVELAKLCDLAVLEAIPYFPGAAMTGQPPRAAKLAKLPASEMVSGIETFYMRQLYLPKVGVPLAMPLYMASLAPYRKLARRYDVILATWAYPDGCASTLFAKAIGKPVAVKVHGSDMNVVAKMKSARAIMRRVLPRAGAMISVARSLSSELEALGVKRIHLVPNGVDSALFYPRDKAEARRALGLPMEGKVITFVGRLEPQKGLGELLEAFPRVRDKIPDATLALVGDGVWRDRAKGEGIVAPGARPLAEVAQWVAASDVFTLPSHNEGTPNVVLEALASGRPAVASRVGGIPDVLADPRSGILVPAKDAAALAEGLVQALSRSWDPAEVAACGPVSWAESARRLHEVLAAVQRGARP